MRVRAADIGDRAAYARLFPELGVDDTIFEEQRFAREMMPTTIARSGTRSTSSSARPRT